MSGHPDQDADMEFVRDALHTLYAYTSDEANPPGNGRSETHSDARAALARLATRLVDEQSAKLRYCAYCACGYELPDGWAKDCCPGCDGGFAANGRAYHVIAAIAESVQRLKTSAQFAEPDDAKVAAKMLAAFQAIDASLNQAADWCEQYEAAALGTGGPRASHPEGSSVPSASSEEETKP